MFVKFTIEPDALVQASVSDIRNLLKSWWEPYGILVFPVKILRALNCKSSVRQLLQESYKTFRSNGYPLWQELDHIDWDNMQTPEDLEGYHPTFELALIEETRAMEFGFPPPFTKNFGNIEAAKLPDMSASAKFDATSSLAQSEIPIGQYRHELWAERFRTLAQVSKEVTIVDRYAAWNFYKEGEDDLRELFRSLNKDSPGCYITIYSSPDAVGRGIHLDRDEIAKRLRNMVSELRLQNIKKITLYLSPDDIFKKYAHDRYIRFDSIKCEIGIGIEVFRYVRTRRNSTFACKSGKFRQETRDIEEALKKSARQDYLRTKSMHQSI